MKVFLESLKTDFYFFGFFEKILVTKVFNNYTVRCKIKFHDEVIQQSQPGCYTLLMTILHFKNLGWFLSIFSSSESFYFELPPHPRCMKIHRKFVEIFISLQFNGMQGMFKSKNIVVTNGTTYCKLKQCSKIVFKFKYFN